jgi:hypothetical protein
MIKITMELQIANSTFTLYDSIEVDPAINLGMLNCQVDYMGE